MSLILIIILLRISFVDGQYSKTKFSISSNGFQIHSSNPSMDQIKAIETKNLIDCTMKCNEIRQCSLFDYHSITKSCRLFLSGSIVSSSSISSRVGFIQSTINDYLDYNRTCTNNPIEFNRFLICGLNLRYECPSKFFWNGRMCTGVYWGIGPQINLNSSLLRGWSLCYNGTYDIQLNGLLLNTILTQCNRSKLLLGCGELNNPKIYKVAAMDYRQNVLYDCNVTSSCSYISNGLKWYYSTNCSWGFADQSDVVVRSCCDADLTNNPSSRLCWHTNAGFDGYRCGSVYFHHPHNGTLYQRVIWHMD